MKPCLLPRMKIFYFQASSYLQRLPLLMFSVSYNYLSIMTLIPIDNKRFLSYLSHVKLFPLIFSILIYHNYHQNFNLSTQTDYCGPLESTGTSCELLIWGKCQQLLPSLHIHKWAVIFAKCLCLDLSVTRTRALMPNDLLQENNPGASSQKQKMGIISLWVQALAVFVTATSTIKPLGNIKLPICVALYLTPDVFLCFCVVSLNDLGFKRCYWVWIQFYCNLIYLGTLQSWCWNTIF